MVHGLSRHLAVLPLLLLLAIPAHAQSYGVRSGDRVSIEFFTAAGDEILEITGERIVDREGNIFLPLIGTVEVVDLDAVGIRVKLERLYDDIYPDAVVEVSVLLRVSVTGAVVRPGSFFLDPSTTVAQALAEAGGGEARSGSQGTQLPPNLGAVRLVRDGNVRELNLRAEAPSAEALASLIQSGDWVYVPTASSARSLRDNVTFWSQLATLGISLFILADQIGGG